MIRILATPSSFECGKTSLRAASEKRGIALHFAVRLDFRMVLLADSAVARRILREEFGVIAAEIGMRHEGDFGLDVEALDVDGRQCRHFGKFFSARIWPHLGVGDEIGALAGDHQRQRREITDARPEADDFADVAQMAHIATFDAADHGVGLAADHCQRGNHGGVGSHHGARGIRRHAVPAGVVM